MEGQQRMKDIEKNSICYIVGASDFDSDSFKPMEKDLIISADGGYDNLKKISVHPDILLGDFDSIESLPEHDNIIRYPKIKDDTDMMLAVKEGLKLGYKKFRLYGAMGKRLDHTLANIQVLEYLYCNSDPGTEAQIIDKDYQVMVVRNEKIILKARKEGTIFSMFCLGETAKGVSLSGLKYELNNVEIENNVPIGVSNEFIGKEAVVEVKSGMIVLMVYNEK